MEWLMIPSQMKTTSMEKKLYIQIMYDLIYKKNCKLD